MTAPTRYCACAVPGARCPRPADGDGVLCGECERMGCPTRPGTPDAVREPEDTFGVGMVLS